MAAAPKHGAEQFNGRAEVSVIKEQFPPLTSSGRGLVAATSVMIILTTSWTMMRIVSRNLRKTQYQLEDYLYFVGQFFYYGLAMLFILAATVGGAGNDIDRLSAKHLAHYTRIGLATQVVYAACLIFIKLAIVCMIRRIFHSAGRLFLMASWVIMGLCICWALYTILIAFFSCIPVASAWGAATATKCGDQITAYAMVAILDIITEVSIVLLPMKLVYDLHMNRAHKIALFGVFGAGAITIVFSCVRLYYVYNIDFTNITKSYAEASISSVLQAGIAVMVASSPMLRPVFDRTALRWLGISLRSSQKDTSGKGASARTTTATSRAGVSASHARTAGFNKMSDSEEHLAWEMRSMEGKNRQRAVVQATRLSDDSGEMESARTGGSGQITVTNETIVEGRSIA
ncbi:hypothetical protein B0J13DRAFT_627656 [Dactylonectria estremocensis]|uniref:Rhodopsin domain-containing protein n=1 Tax=Dactylonectria estremocensis TaxID=1079267 RepID=A0A9P9DZ99_9HYPO|nr:hypothetical protein B0J13DRAFT_627656 [Dactylonectria estremocensis]